MLNPPNEPRECDVTASNSLCSGRASYTEPRLKTVGTVEQLTRAGFDGDPDGIDGNDFTNPGS